MDGKHLEKQIETTNGLIDLLVGITDDDDIITSNTIQKLFKNRKAEWCVRLFRLFDHNNNGFITLHDFLDELEALEHAHWKVQATFEFQLHDTHGNNTLTEKEFKEAMIFSAKSSKLNLAPVTLEKLVSTLTTLMSQTSSAPDSFTLEEYLLALEKNSILRGAFSFCSTKFLHRCRYGDKAEIHKSGTIFNISDSHITIARTERVSMVIKALYVVVVVLFSYLIVAYQQSLGATTAVIIARVGGGQLNLHTSLLLFTMLRKTHMFIGNSSYLLSRALCLDLMTSFHARLGKWTVIWTIVHIVGHLLNYTQLKYDNATPTPYEKGQLFYGAYVTGILLTIILTAISSSYMIRKRNNKFRGFEIFYCVHRLTYFYAIILLFHGRKCWQWVTWPLVILLSEWLYRFYFTEAVKPVCARLLAANVTELVLPRPSNFGNYTAGSYAYICVPELSGIEWHPFTIASSSQRRDGTLSFYIRKTSNGSWTDKLRKLIEHKKGEETFALRVNRIKDERKNSFTDADAIAIQCANNAQTSVRKKSLSRPSAYTKNDTVFESSPIRVKPCTIPCAIPQEYGDIESARVNTRITPRKNSRTKEAVMNGESRAQAATANVQECTIKYSESGTVRTFGGLQVYIDGPYFGPTSHVFSVNHAVFAAGGIGITPFVSILESLIQMDRPAMVDNGHDIIHGLNKLQRLDFYWLNNDLDCTSWLTPMLQTAENIRINHPDSALHRILHIHIFLTSISEKTMGRDEALLHLSIDAMRPSDASSGYYDPVLNLKHKIHVGSPNWVNILQHLGEKSPNPRDMTCFFCGPKPIGRNIAKAANEINAANKEWNIRYAEEFFD